MEITLKFDRVILQMNIHLLNIVLILFYQILIVELLDKGYLLDEVLVGLLFRIK